MYGILHPALKAPHLKGHFHHLVGAHDGLARILGVGRRRRRKGIKFSSQ